MRVSRVRLSQRLVSLSAPSQAGLHRTGNPLAKAGRFIGVNYYKARQHSDTKKFKWTSVNDHKAYLEPPCTDENDEGHDTAEAAERHFYDHEAANLRTGKISSAQHPCKHPAHGTEEVWTQQFMEGRLLGSMTMLCDEHLNPEGWMAANPFTPGIEIAASW